ncbi:MAG: methyltransferase domain-containing protein [Phycisphaerales bacterium]|nr:methyltransferase domain-containing protein [Phycisphaerales bacterium]
MVTPPATPLHDLNPTGRFSDRAQDYARYRPSYPGEAIDALLDGLGKTAGLTVVDVGAGTGISARQLADRGPSVIALEPNESMRRAAQAHPRVRFLDGTAESTGLSDRSVDLVLAAQAFHWFRQRQALAEFHRVLRPAARLGLMWNLRDEDHPFTRGYTEIIRDKTGSEPAEMRPFDPDVITADGLFRDVRLSEFIFEQPLDEAALVGRAASASYIPKAGPGWDAIAASLRELARRHAGRDGLTTMRYVTRVYTAAAV